jgi:hypothetical protein
MAEPNVISLPYSARTEIMDADWITQSNCQAIEHLARAIGRLSQEGTTIGVFARLIEQLALDTSNSVNVTAERLGANWSPSEKGA